MTIVFYWFNFAFMVFGQFSPRSGFKLEFVLCKAEPDQDAGGILTFSAFKRANSNFKHLLGENWPNNKNKV